MQFYFWMSLSLPFTNTNIKLFMHAMNDSSREMSLSGEEKNTYIPFLQMELV